MAVLMRHVFQRPENLATVNEIIDAREKEDNMVRSLMGKFMGRGNIDSADFHSNSQCFKPKAKSSGKIKSNHYTIESPDFRSGEVKLGGSRKFSKMGESGESSFKFGKNKRSLQNHSNSKMGANSGVVTNI